MLCCGGDCGGGLSLLVLGEPFAPPAGDTDVLLFAVEDASLV